MRIARALRRSGACLAAIGLNCWLKAMIWGRTASGAYAPSRRAALHSKTASMTISSRAGCFCHSDVSGAKRVSRADRDKIISGLMYSQYVEISECIFIRVEDSKRVNVVGKS